MAFCTQCGAPMQEGQRFCTACGVPRNDPPPAPAPSFQAAPAAAPVEKKNTGLIVALSVTIPLVLVIALVIFLAFPRSASSPNDRPLTQAESSAREANVRTIKSAGMVKIITDNIPEGTNGWYVYATITSDGSLTDLTVTRCDSPSPQVMYPENGSITGTYRVPLSSTTFS